MSEVYCVCRKPAGLNKDMIGCDKCQNWYHCECLGLTAKQVAVLPETWFCPPCNEILNKDKLVSTVKEEVLAAIELHNKQIEISIKDLVIKEVAATYKKEDARFCTKDEMERMKKDYEDDIQGMKETHAKEMQIIKKDYEGDIQCMIENHIKEVECIKKEYEQQYINKEDARFCAKDEMERMKKDYEDDIQGMKETHAKEMQIIKKDYEGDIQCMMENHIKEVECIKKEYEQQSIELKQKDDEINGLKRKCSELQKFLANKRKLSLSQSKLKEVNEPTTSASL